MQSAVLKMLQGDTPPPAPAGRRPRAPGHLDAQARSKWAEVLPILQGRGDVDQGTLDAAACYCVAWSRWTAAEAQVQALGPVVKSPAGFPVPNPYLNVAAAAQRQMRQWGAELGLTPAGRKKLKIEPTP